MATLKNLASAISHDDSAEDSDALDSEPGEAKDPETQAGELAFEALKDDDVESFIDAMRNFVKLCGDADYGSTGPKKKPVLISKLGGKG